MTLPIRIQAPSAPPGGIRPALERLPQARRQPQDTAEGCFLRAADDRLRAAAMATAIGRAKMEHSAGAWTERGMLLDRLEKSFAARRPAGGAA